MADTIYKQVEITGTSSVSMEDAIQTAIARASKTIPQMQWFEVTEVRGRIDEDHVHQWQVTVKIGFALED